MAELAGLILAERYQLLDELGRGSSGAVYRARDLQLERDVAVKCVMPTAAVDAQTRARFLREGQLIARLDHPAIVPIHDAGDQDGLLYFVMPLVDGKTLRHYLREDQPTVDTLLEIAVQIGEALHYAHDRGVVHRDVKPENILVVGGVGGDVRARLMDFGLARAGFDSQLTQLTEVGAVVGTVAYLSPEQVVDSTRADGRCDLYALGVVLFEALCGALPFDGDVHAILYRIVHETPAPVCSRNPAIDRELGKLIDACMVKDAAARLSLREFLAGLARYRNSVDRRRLEFRPADKVVAGTAPRPASPFVGREAELNELRGRFETVSHGEPALVLVTGEPGTGKSALLEELRRIGAELGFVVLTGRCADAGEPLPFHGLYEVCRAACQCTPAPTLFADVAEDLVRLFPALADLISSDIRTDAGAPGWNRDDVLDMLARAVTAIARALGPCAMAIDDLHRSAETTQAIERAFKQLHNEPLMLVLAGDDLVSTREHLASRFRALATTGKSFVHIELGPLGSGAHRLLLDRLLGGHRVREPLAARLYEATDGNPFFTTELVRSLAESGALTFDETGAVDFKDTSASLVSLPATIQRAIERRIEGLSTEFQLLLETAAVLGLNFDIEDLDAVARRACLNDVHELVRLGLLEQTGDAVRFSSGVLHDVLYARLSRRRRRSLHQLALESLERRTAPSRQPSKLAFHAAAANLVDRAARYSLTAARRALESFAANDAVNLANMAIDYLAESAGSDAVELGEARLVLARGIRLQGDAASAGRHAELAAEVFDSAGNDAQLAAAAEVAAAAFWAARDVDRARSWVERGLRAARAVGDRDVLHHLLTLAATIENLSGRPVEAALFSREAAIFDPAAPAAAPVVGGGTVAVPVHMPIFESLDPSLVTSLTQSETVTNVFETLTRADDRATVQPWLAERFEMSEGGRSWRLIVRSDVRFHDGRRLTAEDVVYSLERVLRLGRPRGLAVLYAVKGAHQVAEGSQERLAGATMVNNLEVRFELDRPAPFFAALLSDPVLSVVPAGSLAHSDFEAIGTGPFRVASFGGDTLELTRFDGYWRAGLPRCERLRFQFGVPFEAALDRFKRGELSLLSTLPPEHYETVRRDALLGRNYVEAPALSTAFIAFNQHRSLFADLELRRAVATLLDAPTLLRRAGLHTMVPASSIIPPHLLGRSRATVTTPVGAGSDVSLDGLRVVAGVSPGLLGPHYGITEEIVSVLAAKGITVEIYPTGGELRHSGLEQRLDLHLSSWGADYPDPDSFAHGLLHSQVGELGRFCGDSELDRLIESGRTHTDAAARRLAYEAFERYVEREALLVPLFHPQRYRFARPEVEGLAITGLRFPAVQYELLQVSPVEPAAGQV